MAEDNAPPQQAQSALARRPRPAGFPGLFTEIQQLISRGETFSIQDYLPDYPNNQQPEDFFIIMVFRMFPSVYQLPQHEQGMSDEQVFEKRLAQIPCVPVSNQQIREKEQCIICFENYTLEEMVRKLPCRHSFHGDCIIPWLRDHNTCPYCRAEAFTQT